MDTATPKTQALVYLKHACAPLQAMRMLETFAVSDGSDAGADWLAAPYHLESLAKSLMPSAHDRALERG